jgi:hypothetical protein
MEERKESEKKEKKNEKKRKRKEEPNERRKEVKKEEIGKEARKRKEKNILQATALLPPTDPSPSPSPGHYTNVLMRLMSSTKPKPLIFLPLLHFCSFHFRVYVRSNPTIASSLFHSLS